MHPSEISIPHYLIELFHDFPVALGRPDIIACGKEVAGIKTYPDAGLVLH